MKRKVTIRYVETRLLRNVYILVAVNIAHGGWLQLINQNSEINDLKQHSTDIKRYV
jgi:hypothetical protein